MKKVRSMRVRLQFMPGHDVVVLTVALFLDRAALTAIVVRSLMSIELLCNFGFDARIWYFQQLKQLRNECKSFDLWNGRKGDDFCHRLRCQAEGPASPPQQQQQQCIHRSDRINDDHRIGLKRTSSVRGDTDPLASVRCAMLQKRCGRAG